MDNLTTRIINCLPHDAHLLVGDGRAVTIKQSGMVARVNERLSAPVTLTVATEGTYRPFSFHDESGALTGYDVEIAQAVADKLGLKVRFQETQWDAIFAGLDAGRFDVIANQVSITPERQAKYLFSSPYTVSRGVVVTTEDDSSISSFADLAGKTTAQSLTSNWYELATSSGAQVEAVEESFEHDMIRAPLLTSLPFMPFDADLSGWSLIYLGVLSKYGVAMFHGGTGSLPKALIGVLKDNRGDIITSSPVEQLIVEGNRCTGVRIAGGTEIRARRGVLTACSPKTTLTRLLPRGILEHKKQVAADHIPTRKRGIADAKVNVALSGRVNMSKHEKWRGDGIDLRLACNCYHTYQQAIDAARACVRGQVPDAIPGLAQVTNAFDPSMSPKGKDLWWFWTGLTPSFPEEGWDVARKKITDSIIKDADEYYQGVEDLQIAVRPLVLPDIEERFWAIDGSVYHVDPTIARFGPNKPVTGFAGYRTPVEGLFLTGSGTHPVAGISGMPGQNAARTMLKQFHLEDKGGRLGILKDRLWRDRRRAAALTTDPYTSGPNDPFPGQE